MKRFACARCGHEVYFENLKCENCGSLLAIEPGTFDMRSLSEDGASGAGRACGNREETGCNWLLAEGDEENLCVSCRSTKLIPDLSDPEAKAGWARLESAKRHLYYSLVRLGLKNAAETSARPLHFQFLSAGPGANGDNGDVVTGHADGLITIDVAEADHAEREERREHLGETYRTMIGHLRHEVGHYFWDVLVRDAGRLEAFRSLFGDERQDYAAALQQHYDQGPPPGWNESFVSAYASSHPWEDFAESWAHYFHIIDGLETSYAYGFTGQSLFQERGTTEATADFYEVASVKTLVDAWVPLTVAVNAINRSLGQPDLYPFVLSDAITEKLEFIHGLMPHNA